MIDNQIILKKKAELLCSGIYLDETLIKHYTSKGIKINFGRKGGAGPLAGRYFLLEDNTTLVNIALWNERGKTNLVLSESVNGYFKVYNNAEKSHFANLKLISIPDFYNLKTSDGFLMNKIALVHGIDCLGSTIYQKCKYWTCGEACKFCGIELSLKHGTTILEKTPQQISEVIIAAKKEGRCAHMTLTSGTTEEDDKGTARYIEILKFVKKNHPNITFHVQTEPFEDLDYISKLKEAGADTIGIHIEVLDPSLRKTITPGKYKISYELFENNWKHALDVFGKNQVETYILLGYGESPDKFINNLEKVISIGVIPYVTPVRPIPGRTSNQPIINYQNFLQITIMAAKMLHQYGVNPLENNAGCVRCGGCSAISEAYKAI